MDSARLAAAIAATALLAGGCTTEPIEHLAGCFSLDADGKPTVQVIQEDDQYTVAMHRDGKWDSAKPMQIGAPELAKQLFGEDAAKIQASLVNEEGPIALFKVEPKQTIAGGTADSGFIGSFYFGTGQIYKAESCEDL